MIRITGGSWWCYLCNKEHGEGAGCPLLPRLRSKSDIEEELKEAVRKMMETEKAGNEKTGTAKM
ncbi:hypothetical protein [Xenorhabdus bovienii]|uniref:Uncharacterized protein n=1 Tax=Xenorhabdus bovienii str. kraussei Becker Underwood TaxID=1398204 RepID=A0A077Q3V1_XENBV|nr:hypothetical protein [Xenorhabdus bovienii]CDH26754.1 hypothetical protein XBKB1_910019 [Xenorhabdus bovienii str. kraussei Becker Underwood]